MTYRINSYIIILSFCSFPSTYNTEKGEHSMRRDITKTVCKKCGKPFRFTVVTLECSDEKTLKEIGCPWCGEIIGSFSTKAEIISRRISDDSQDTIS